MNRHFSASDNKYAFRVFLNYAEDFLKKCEMFGLCSADTTYFCDAGAVFIPITKRTCSCKALITVIRTKLHGAESFLRS
jgi:hypothetical protein